MGPTFNLKKIKKNKITNQSFHYSHGQKQKVRDFVNFYFYFQIFSLRFTEFRSSDFVGSNTESALRDEGYA